MSTEMVRCPHHGWVKGPDCVACLAQVYKEARRLRGSPSVELKEGVPLKQTDPSPAEIRLMAAVIRDKKGKERLPPRGWKRRRRVVRIYSANLFESYYDDSSYP